MSTPRALDRALRCECGSDVRLVRAASTADPGLRRLPWQVPVHKAPPESYGAEGPAPRKRCPGSGRRVGPHDPSVRWLEPGEVLGVCRNCDSRRPVRLASRLSGGNYRHPGSRKPTNVCEECALRLLADATPGHTSSSRWGLASLRHAWGR